MANELYRTYEVLIEESVHPDNPKRQRTEKESRYNAMTSRALQTTNDVFQDAVCYYLFLIIGLLRDVPETERYEINPLWRTLNGPLKSKVEDLLKRLSKKYPDLIPHSTEGGLDLLEFLRGTYSAGLDLTKETLQATYETMRNEGCKKKKNKETNQWEVNPDKINLKQWGRATVFL